MKENTYDNPIFFQKYSQMLRSTQGLEGAGEWRELQKLLPDFAGKRVLDLGCGYGWHCGYAAGHGAAYVLGTDLSEKMLETQTARTKSNAEKLANALGVTFETIDITKSVLQHFEDIGQSVDDLSVTYENGPA